MEASGCAPTCFAVDEKFPLQSAGSVGKLSAVGKGARAVLGGKDIGFGVVHGRRKVRVRWEEKGEGQGQGRYRCHGRAGEQA